MGSLAKANKLFIRFLAIARIALYCRHTEILSAPAFPVIAFPWFTA